MCTQTADSCSACAITPLCTDSVPAPCIHRVCRVPSSAKPSPTAQPHTLCRPRPCLRYPHHWHMTHTVRLAIACPTAWHHSDSCQLCPSPLSSHSKTGHFVHICAHISTPMRPPDSPLRTLSFLCQDTYDYTVGIPWNCFRVRGLPPLAAESHQPAPFTL